jgi:hypothetical protein
VYDLRRNPDLLSRPDRDPIPSPAHVEFSGVDDEPLLLKKMDVRWPAVRARLNTLEVRGRRTGKLRSFPVVVADYQGERYVVAMLGEGVNWVANVRASSGHAVLRHGRREPVRLEEVAPAIRAPILQRYLQLAPGARAHVPVDSRAPLAEFEAIAHQYPIFRVRADLPGHT